MGAVLSPLEAAILAIFMPLIVALLSHITAKLPKVGAGIAKATCIFTAYLSLLFVSMLVPVVRDEPFRNNLFSIPLPTGVVNTGIYVDCLSLIPALLVSLFTALALTYNVHYLSPYNRAYKVGWEFNRSYSFILLFNGAMLGALFSDNLLNLLIFLELISLCSYVLISFWDEDEFSLRAAIKAFIMTHMGSLALLIVTVIVYSITGALEISALGQKMLVGDNTVHIILLLILIAALPKTVLFPLHTWLPDATVAPTSAILVFHEGGTLVGIYMIIRFFSSVFRMRAASITTSFHPLLGGLSVWGLIISLVGALTLLIGVLNGLVEDDFKRIVAYGTISELGYITIAAGLSTPLSITAAIFLMISHAFTFGLLFLCAGAVIYVTGKYSINDVEGLYQRMPITALCCLTGVLSMSTVPLLIDFVGKYLLFNAIIDVKAIFLLVIAFLGCILNAAVAIRVFYTVFIRRTARSLAGLVVEDPPAPMIIPLVLISIVIIFFGVAPTVLLNLFVTPAIRQLFNEPIISIVSQEGVVETPLGFWNPVVTTISVLVFLTLFTFIILYSRKVRRSSYRELMSEETAKPFLCGEDLRFLDGPQAHYFYQVLADILRVDRLCHILNIDRAYNLLSISFFNLAERMRSLDIQQNYFPAVLSFTIGALIIVILAVLVG